MADNKFRCHCRPKAYDRLVVKFRLWDPSCWVSYSAECAQPEISCVSVCLARSLSLRSRQVLPGLLHHPLVHSTHVVGATGTALPGCSDSSCHMQDIAVELRAGPTYAHACCVLIVASLLVVCSVVRRAPRMAVAMDVP